MDTSTATPPADEAQTLISLIEAVLTRRLGDNHAPWRIGLVSRQASHGGTHVFRAVSAAGRAVAAKIYRRRHLVHAEQQAAAQMAGAGAATARVLFADPETGLIAFDWHEGASMDARLGSDQGLATIRQAGRWLATLHAARQGRPRIHHPMRFLVELCDTANGHGGAILPDERVAFTRALSATAHAAARSVPGLYRPVRLHGDFLPQNLLCTAQGLVAVDVMHTRTGQRHDDIAGMTANLLLRGQIGTLGGLDGPAARAAFLSAYGLRAGSARLLLAERVELLKRWQFFANDSFPHRGNGLAKVRAVQALFRARGWPVGD